MKKLGLMILLFVLILGNDVLAQWERPNLDIFIYPVLEENGIKTLKLKNDDGESFSVYSDDIHALLMVNGDILSNAFPIAENGHSLVPIRALSEKLGLGVQWDETMSVMTQISSPFRLSGFVRLMIKGIS